MARGIDNNELAKLREPTAKEFAQIVSALGLSQEQTWHLERTVRNAVATAKAYYEKKVVTPDPDMIREKAETIDELLSKLEAEIDLGRAAVVQIETPDNLGALGLLVSFHTIAEVFGKDEIDRNVTDYVNSRANDGNAANLLELEWEFAQPKQVLDARNRPKLLLYVVKALRQQFRLWLDSQGVDPGGHAPRPARRIMISALLQDSSHILGKPPTKTGGVAIQKLCTEVFHACGIDTDGLTDAIRYCLKDLAELAKVQFYNEIEK